MDDSKQKSNALLFTDDTGRCLITGAPCLASGDNGETSVFGSSDTNAEDEVSDLSGEGQIHKPASLNAPDFTADPNFVDDSTDNTYGYYTIMGTTTVSLAQMTSQYNAHGSEYPSASLKEGGAETIDDFCTIILEEANAEGVRGEVVFEQAMLETGWLQYGGDSGISQYNFAGLGTTGGGVQGVSYPDVRTGIRAQVQHLKAYACDESLNQDCSRHPLQHGPKRQRPIRRMARTAGKSQWRRLGRPGQTTERNYSIY